MHRARGDDSIVRTTWCPAREHGTLFFLFANFEGRHCTSTNQKRIIQSTTTLIRRSRPLSPRGYVDVGVPFRRRWEPEAQARMLALWSCIEPSKLRMRGRQTRTSSRGGGSSSKCSSVDASGPRSPCSRSSEAVHCQTSYRFISQVRSSRRGAQIPAHDWQTQPQTVRELRVP